ncbi:hypothetical protein GCM10007884_00380 [Methylobacterium brachythecii]|uniref:Uncharacterized protein n=1 Tax=Methylobacterium brachythecii TaxID=1176177 RepID=A0ABQ6D1C8_9HYPH|nr:hypothetical protein GCM10007884_00380 [Methylobacterium brachythecii]
MSPCSDSPRWTDCTQSMLDGGVTKGDPADAVSSPDEPVRTASGGGLRLNLDTLGLDTMGDAPRSIRELIRAALSCPRRTGFPSSSDLTSRSPRPLTMVRR